MPTFSDMIWADGDTRYPVSAARMRIATAGIANAANWARLMTYLPGDGVTDVTDIIQEALDEIGNEPMPGMKFQNSSGGFEQGLQANGGGMVMLPPGVHVVGPLLNRHRGHLTGIGRATVLKARANSTGPVFTNQYDATVISQYGGISYLTIDGNKAAQTVANHGIHLRGDTTNNYTSPYMEDYDQNGFAHLVYVKNTKGDGIRMDGAGANLVTDCKVLRADGNGIYSFQDNHIQGCDVGWSGLAGVRISGESCTITNTKAWYSGQVTPSVGHGFYMDADSGAISGCNAQDNRATGFCWDGAFGWGGSALLSDSNSRGSAGTYPAFDFYGSSFINLSGLAARNRYNASYNSTSSVGEQAYAVRLRNGCTQIVADITAATGVWGQSSTYLAPTSVTSGNFVRVNGAIL